MSSHVGDLSAEDDGGFRESWINSDNVDFLVRPALPGRKTHRGWYREVLRRQGQDRSRDVGGESDLSNMADTAEALGSGQTLGRRGSSGSDRHGNEARMTLEEVQDQFWSDVRSSQTVTEEREEEEEQEGEEENVGEGASGVREVQAQTANPVLMVPTGGDRRTSRRETNRVRCLRRRQRKRRQQDSPKSTTSSSSSSSSSSEEDDLISEGLLCAVCLDVYFCPYMCHPCNHIFCEPCLRTLAKNCPTNTPCPLCRTSITHVFFQKELNQTARTFFPKEYLSRKQNFQKAACAKWPLPSCRKLFRMFGGFPRQWSPMARRRFPPHSGPFRVDPLELEELGELGERSSARWRLDMDMVIIYIYSVNWIIGFIILCLLCYVFLPSQ